MGRSLKATNLIEILVIWIETRNMIGYKLWQLSSWDLVVKY